MLNVSYINKIGYYTLTQNSVDGTRKFRIDICHANCLCALMYFYTAEDGSKMAQVNGFCVDIKHLKALLKNDFFAGADNFVFRAKEMNSDLWNMVRVLANNGKKISIK